MSFIKAFGGVEVLLGAEAVVCSGEIVEGSATFGSHGVWLLSSEAFEDEGGGHSPSFLIETYLCVAPGVEDTVVHVG